MYTVKEISKLLNMSEHTVRYYTDMGLVPTLKRDKNGNRLFDENSKNWLIGIKNLRGSGMSIKAVKDYVDLCLQGESTLDKRYEIIIEQKMQLEKQLKEMNERYNYITHKANWYLDIMNHRIPDNSDPGTWSISSSESQENSSESQIMTKHDVS
ncbi:MerR family transcriptional regulator [Clostridium neonatale]|uniref:MerR family transcriptional regulator n=1 Tax=Clostridium neonatale TaxID=137838 RepID=A0A2A7MHV1_9CLOT|nr:MerR family transcriptional regulator [Clostridium neonatale]PEG27547.1 MerR family transcriptional regulator [Clostridium neonatale]PEG31256.1 MerR family transcriptional regulator [Clostridium neonatale]CAH0437281.1 Putative transcriptional regulator, MerR-type [Clostridium neonatale]CAI3232236.1 putative transcriptional regulator, MerR-type [Clostridium neonatale]